MKKSLMEWHFLAIIANSDVFLLLILLNVVQPQYGGLVSAFKLMVGDSNLKPSFFVHRFS